MLKIKLTPLGKRNSHQYRIVLAEEHSKLTGKNLVILGRYNPFSKELVIDKEAVSSWMKKGAQPTDRVRKLLNI